MVSNKVFTIDVTGTFISDTYLFVPIIEVGKSTIVVDSLLGLDMSCCFRLISELLTCRGALVMEVLSRFMHDLP